jgi:LemA protein
MAMMGMVPLAVVLLAVAWVIVIYNSLVRQRNEVKSAWSQIDVQLKRRHDLVPNLVETVKGYAQHERNTLEAVTKARQQAVNFSGDPAATARVESLLSQTLKSLFAVAENYPELKADRHFLSLQEELTSTENRIGFARQYFNDAVLALNNRIGTFPGNLVAGAFNFREASFFELDTPAPREAPPVRF